MERGIDCQTRGGGTGEPGDGELLREKGGVHIAQRNATVFLQIKHKLSYRLDYKVSPTHPQCGYTQARERGKGEHRGMRRTQARSNSISGGGKPASGEGASELVGISSFIRRKEGRLLHCCTAVLARDHDGVCTAAQAWGRV